MKNLQQMQQIMKQVQQIQEQLQKQLDELLVEASSGGGMVAVKMNGQKQLVAVHIDREVFASARAEVLDNRKPEVAAVRGRMHARCCPRALRGECRCKQQNNKGGNHELSHGFKSLSLNNKFARLHLAVSNEPIDIHPIR